MSTLVENVAKVTAAHAALKTAIASKGVAVPDGTKLSAMPALVEQIQTGGATEPTNPRAVFAYDGSNSIVVPKILVVDMTTATDLSSCFSYCTKMTSLTLPDGFGQAATTLSYCFRNCPGITSLSLPAGFGQAATDLGHCFHDCNFLASLTLPDRFGQNSTSLYYCFCNCYKLASLTLPDGCGQEATSLGSCFCNCNALTSLHLPSGFGQNATTLYNCFYGCSALTDITGNPNFKESVGFSYSKNLTHDSLMVVINGLQTVTGKTLTLGTTNLAKLTDAEKKVATDKGWTLA
jgi:hypothetical protein